MKSIRTRLILWLTAGLSLVLIASGIAIYLAVRHSLLRSLDANLALDAGLVRFAARGEESDWTNSKPSRRLRDRMPTYHDPEGDAYFQRWDTNGTSLDKSISLGEIDLAFPGGNIATAPSFASEVLGDGRAVRTMKFRSPSGGKGKSQRGARGVVVLLARDLAEVQESLAGFLKGLVAIGLASLLFAILVIRVSLHGGLRPLRRLSEETSEIDAESLDSRFDATRAPSELLPIYHQLNDLLRRLEQSFEREREFGDNLAHEMRTPIAELRLINEVALEWKDQSGEKAHQESLTIANQLGATVESLLSLARSASGDLQVNLQAVDLAELIRETWSPFAAAADQKALGTRLDLSESQPITTDRTLMAQTLTNLFSNAVDYSPDGGTIHIQSQDNSLTVSNRAPDLTSGDLDRLFDRHWRKDPARSTVSHAGLGLSLVHEYSRALGFEVSVTLTDGTIALRLDALDAGTT